VHRQLVERRETRASDAFEHAAHGGRKKR
jgi:hypothetical protein